MPPWKRPQSSLRETCGFKSTERGIAEPALDLAKRAGDCGLTTIAVTCDVPVTPNRERNRRNGFAYPPKLTLPMILQTMLHPSWVASCFGTAACRRSKTGRSMPGRTLRLNRSLSLFASRKRPTPADLANSSKG